MNVRSVVVRKLPFAGLNMAVGVFDGLLLPFPWSAFVTLAVCCGVIVFRVRIVRRDRMALNRQFAERMRADTHQVTVLPPSATFGLGAQEAYENLRMAFGHQLPACEPIGPCLRCSLVAAHLFTDRSLDLSKPLIGRECRSCGYTWRERLDA